MLNSESNRPVFVINNSILPFPEKASNLSILATSITPFPLKNRINNRLTLKISYLIHVRNERDIICR